MSSVARIDLNSDMGESFGVYTLGSDAEMLDIVTSANVACGFHAGDPLVMHRTMKLAYEKGTGVGAHPSFLDLWGFGRRQIIGEDPNDIEKILIYQIGAAQAVAASVGHRITHVKTHGTLGTIANEEPELAAAIVRAVKTVNPELLFIAMPGTEVERAGERQRLRIAREIYCDRTYQDNGNLTPRKKSGAVIHDPEHAVTRALRMIESGAIISESGKTIPVAIDTICVHGDTPGAVNLARRLRAGLAEAGVEVKPMHTFL